MNEVLFDFLLLICVKDLEIKEKLEKGKLNRVYWRRRKRDANADNLYWVIVIIFVLNAYY